MQRGSSNYANHKSMDVFLECPGHHALSPRVSGAQMSTDEKWKFRASDFDPDIGPADDGEMLCTYEWAALRAQAKLASWIASAPVVTTGWEPSGDGGMADTFVWRTSYKPHKNPTHTARLICIEEIKRDTAEAIVADLARWAMGRDGVAGKNETGLGEICGRAKTLGRLLNFKF